MICSLFIFSFDFKRNQSIFEALKGPFLRAPSGPQHCASLAWWRSHLAQGLSSACHQDPALHVVLYVIYLFYLKKNFLDASMFSGSVWFMMAVCLSVLYPHLLSEYYLRSNHLLFLIHLSFLLRRLLFCGSLSQIPRTPALGKMSLREFFSNCFGPCCRCNIVRPTLERTWRLMLCFLMLLMLGFSFLFFFFSSVTLLCSFAFWIGPVKSV